MNGIEAVCRLVNLGYRPHKDGEGIRLKWHGLGEPDPATVRPLLEAVRQHRDQVRAHLKTLVVCQDCAHAQVGDGWAFCQTEPWDGIPGQVPDYPHPCQSFARREPPLTPPERILSCAECPWYAGNPWTHYPELPAWCNWHMDNLAADNPACISYRRQEIPEAPKAIGRTRTNMEHAPPEVKKSVARQKAPTKSKVKAVFNRTNENIEWASWTWNPVTGCKHGCNYCYARDIAMRFNGSFEPKFHRNRLTAPRNTPLPDSSFPGDFNVFVCSMADLFGDWVPQEWIDAVLEVVRQASQWNFLFLTKNPKRLVGIDWPFNAWVGTTVDIQARVKTAEDVFRQIKAAVKFVSCEPLLEELTFSDLRVFDWVITGGCRRPGQNPKEADQPDWNWVLSLDKQARKAGCMRYWKPNLKVPKGFPMAEVPKEFPTTGKKKL